MTVPGNVNPLLLASAATTGPALQVQRSLRFNSSDSAYLSRTPAVAGNRRTWTWAGWVKRSGLGAFQSLFCCIASNLSHYLQFTIESDDCLLLYDLVATSGVALKTTQVFRDPSAWYHIVLQYNTTNATASNKVKLYVNGSEITQFSVDNRSSLTSDSSVNRAEQHSISGRQPYSTEYFNGYLADIHFIDGQALTPSSFTEVSATTGQLIPKAYSGGSYGTNGFYLQFADNSSNTAATLGKDTSGNSNNWTPNNVSVASGGPTSVAAASGALPILNTTDTYGATLGSGVRSDAFASSLQFCIPGGTSAGLNLTDQNPSGRVSPLRNLSGASLVNDTSTSKFYGGSLSVPLSVTGTYSNDVWSSIGSGPFTVEMWMYLVDSTMSSGWGYNVLVGRKAYDGYVNIGLAFGGVAGSKTGARMLCVPNLTQYVEHYLTENGAEGPFPVGQWVHCAQTRDSSGTVRTFKNGIKVAETTGITAALVINYPEFGGWTTGYGYPIEFKVSDMRVYNTAKYTSNFNPPSSTANATVAAGNDSLVDTPTSFGTDTGVGGEVRGNYCTLNPLNSTGILSNGNLDINTAAGYFGNGIASGFGMASEKWYFEATVNSVSGASAPLIGIVTSGFFGSTIHPGATAYGWEYQGYGGSKQHNSSPAAYGVSFTAGDTVACSFDADAGSLVFYKNGVSQGVAYTGLTNGPYFFVVGDHASSGSATFSVNFGQRAFAYTAPSGFKALCDTNIPEGTITTSGTYTGNGVADGPFVYLNGVPTAMTVGGNAVTFGTHADKLSNGFKLRTTSTTYNQNALNYSYSITATGAKFKYARAQPNP